jgi:thymidine phosphorylase
MKTLPEARALAESLVRVGTANGLKVEAVITAMDAPLGRAVGNALEVIEAIETLKGNGPKDLEDLSVLLAAKMVRLAGLAADDMTAEAKVRKALTSGAGLEKFRQIIERQGGDPMVIWDYPRLHTAPSYGIETAQRGYVVDVHALKIGIAAMLSGAGRMKAEDRIDHAVGIEVLVRPGDEVFPGQQIFRFYSRGERPDLTAALHWAAGVIQFGTEPPPPTPLVLETIT